MKVESVVLKYMKQWKGVGVFTWQYRSDRWFTGAVEDKGYYDAVKGLGEVF